MGEWLHWVVLAIVQGLTEFLPISSSGHLLLAEWLLGLQTQGLVLEVAVHLGTLVAVLHYFRRECWQMGLSLLHWQDPRRQTDRRLFGFIVIATVPVCVAGLLAHDWFSVQAQSVRLMAWATLGFGILLGLADRFGKRERDLSQMRLADALLLGAMQVLALIPGTSRSGITLTAGLFAGFDRQSAARFSFLLSIPTIAAAGALESLKLFGSPEPVAWLPLLLAAVLAGVVGWLTMHVFLLWLQRLGLMPFVIYRVLLGLILLVFLT